MSRLDDIDDTEAVPCRAPPPSNPSALDDLFGGVSSASSAARPAKAAPPTTTTTVVDHTQPRDILDDFFTTSPSPSAGLKAPSGSPSAKSPVSGGSVNLLGAVRDSAKHAPQSFEQAFEQNLAFRNTSGRPKTLSELSGETLYVPPPNVLPLMNHYEVLGVARSATTDELVRAYRKLALAFHPDKRGAELTQQEEVFFKAVTKAHEVLVDPVQREEYNRTLMANVGQQSNTLFSHMP